MQIKSFKNKTFSIKYGKNIYIKNMQVNLYKLCKLILKFNKL